MRESFRSLRKFSGAIIVNWRIHKTIRYHHEGTKDTKMGKLKFPNFTL
jgi:hypothetical protein